MIAWLLISFAVMMVLGVPIGISLGLSAMGGIIFLDGGSLVTVTQRMFEGMNSWALLAVPLYTFAGYTMSKGGISKRLMDFCYSIVGHIYGGLAHVNVLASMIFAGISGSAVADTAGVSGMFMPEMVRKGYSKELSVTVTAVSSTIGIIIPPSIPMVVIAGICGISTGKMFLGGILPGILIGIVQMVISYFFAKKEGVQPESGRFTFKELGRTFLGSWPALLMPFVIITTITSGVVSPTEAGAIAVVYGLFCGGIVYKELKLGYQVLLHRDHPRFRAYIRRHRRREALHHPAHHCRLRQMAHRRHARRQHQSHRHPCDDPPPVLLRDDVHGIHRRADPVHAHRVPHRHECRC